MAEDSGFHIARTVAVSPERLSGWLSRFIDRHGALTVAPSSQGLLLTGANGAKAHLINRWEPRAQSTDLSADFLRHLLKPRTVAVLLARKSSHGVGIFHGTDLLVHRIGRHYVQGRTKAGGWSQQRYARRRSNQASKAYGKALQEAMEILLPKQVDAFICGGDSAAVKEILSGGELDTLTQLRWQHPIYPVPDPKLVVLRSFAETFRAVPIDLDAIAAGPAT